MIKIIFGKLIENKNKAFKSGTIFMDSIQKKMDEHIIDNINTRMQSYSTGIVDGENEHRVLSNKYIGISIVDAINFIYDDSEFYEYLKFSFLGKYYERKISFIKKIILLFLIVLIALTLYLTFERNMYFFLIPFVILLFIALMVVKFNTGESYDNYYKRTMMKLLCSCINNVSFNEDKFELTNDEIKDILKQDYSYSTFGNAMNFTSSNMNGKMIDMTLTEIKENVDKNGVVHKKRKKVFDGFYVNLNSNTSFDRLKGNAIKIREDENLMSLIGEDTVKGIYESDREFEFNSEELNKSFDCKISKHFGVEDVNNAVMGVKTDIDDVLMEVQKIITPTFEEHLLYLRKRYNSFNMNIRDNSMTLSFNLDKTLFQRVRQEGSLFHKDTYCDLANKDWMLHSSLSSIDDVTYYNVFIFLEKLYMINYYKYFYLNYMTENKDYVFSIGEMMHYEEQMNSICETEAKEFKKIHTDEIKNIDKDVRRNPDMILDETVTIIGDDNSIN